MAARILVLGGGFAGLSAVNRLVRARQSGVDIEVRLIDAEPAHVFAPALPDLISSRLRPEHLQHKLGPHCSAAGIQFTRSPVLGIDSQSMTVATEKGSFSADFIIVALGCVTNYYGNDAARKSSFGLKSVGGAQNIHRRTTEAADRIRTGEPAGATVVVGGGYTGFEAATHVAWYLHHRTGLDYKQIAAIHPIIIADLGDAMLKACAPSVRKWTLEKTATMCVQMRPGTTVEAFEDGAVALTDGTRLTRATTVWAAGFRTPPVLDSLPAERAAAGRILVDENLRLPKASNVFVVGDAASFTPQGQDVPLRMSVQFSLSGGKCAAENVLKAIGGKPPRRYKPVDLGYVVPLGCARGAGIILGHFAWGIPPSLLHYFMCALRSWSWRNRLGILKDRLTGGLIDE